jgi:AcrR family transcriptional regulator
LNIYSAASLPVHHAVYSSHLDVKYIFSSQLPPILSAISFHPSNIISLTFLMTSGHICLLVTAMKDRECSLPSTDTVAASGMAVNSGTGRRQRRATETRIRLFRTAIQLFAERGFTNVTVENITEAADVGKGTFFNYFASKDHVLGVLAEIQLSKVSEAVKQAPLCNQSMQSLLHTLARRLVEEPGKSPELARAVITSFLSSDIVRKLLKEQISVGRAQVAKCIRIGQKNGEINPKLKSETVAIQFQQAVMGSILLWSLHGKPPLARWIEDSFQHFWRAVATPNQEES